MASLTVEKEERLAMMRNRSRSPLDGWVSCTTRGTGGAGLGRGQTGGSQLQQDEMYSHHSSSRGSTGAVSSESDLEVRRAVEQLLPENCQLQDIEEKVQAW